MCGFLKSVDRRYRRASIMGVVKGGGVNELLRAKVTMHEKVDR